MNLPNYHSLLQNFLGSQNFPDSFSDTPHTELDTSTNIQEFLGEDLLWEETIPEQLPVLYPLPKSLPKPLRKALKALGITQLYSHQRQTLKALREGKDVILTTNTASGKSLSAYLPILEGILKHDYTALSFYGLKALTTDQEEKISELISLIPSSIRPQLAMLNGDVNKEEREKLLELQPSLIAVTPELIHYALKGIYWNESWQRFLEKLRYVLIDEAHTFKGAYGANMALLLQRLKLAVDKYGGNSRQLQFIFLSATVGNPRQLARQLSGRKRKADTKGLAWIRHSGAASPQRQLLVTQPSSNPNPDTAKIILFLLRQGLKGICFCNGRVTLKNLLATLGKEAIAQGLWGVQQQVAIFYGGLSHQRRTEILEQLQAGQLHCLLSTSALEAGIDLAALDFAIIRSFPDSLQAFRQRIGRAGRKQQGLAIFIPLEQSPLDRYYAQHPQLLLSASPEQVCFNPAYPIDLGKHLMCAAVESGIAVNQLKRYFGSSGLKIASALLAQGVIRKSRGRLWAKGFPHRDVNFRGGINRQTIHLIETETGDEIEKMSFEIAMREVFPGAIYRTQDSQGQIVTYRCIQLNLESSQALLKHIEETTLYTVAISETETELSQALVSPRQLPLSLTHEEQQGSLSLNLAWGKVTHRVTGYQLLTKQYTKSCLRKRCVNYREALPTHQFCPVCGKRTRKTELITMIDEVTFEQPLAIEFTTPMTAISVNSVVEKHFQQEHKKIKYEGNAPTSVDYSASLLGIHSFGHQILAALPLVILGSIQDVNFLVEAREKNHYVGYFYDLTEGGNGTAEAIFRNLPQLAKMGAELANSCDCEWGCPKCLILPGCPEGNQGLLKQMGLLLCQALE